MLLLCVLYVVVYTHLFPLYTCFRCTVAVPFPVLLLLFSFSPFPEIQFRPFLLFIAFGHPLHFGDPAFDFWTYLHTSAIMAGDDSFSDDPPAVASTVDVKIPEFWIASLALWFKQADAAFPQAKVTLSMTKYDHILIKLPREVLDSVADVVQGVEDDSTDAYEQLKERLVGDYSLTKWQQAAKIVDHPGLGDSRPSALMAQILALLLEKEKPGTSSCTCL